MPEVLQRFIFLKQGSLREGDSSPSHNPVEGVLTTFKQPLKQAVAIELYWKDAF